LTTSADRLNRDPPRPKFIGRDKGKVRLVCVDRVQVNPEVVESRIFAWFLQWRR
jgi:hypothetical protein